MENFFDELSDKHRKAGVDASGMDVFGKVFCKVMRPILLGGKIIPFMLLSFYIYNKKHFYHKTFLLKMSCAMITNTNFRIPISLQPDAVEL